MLKILTIHGFKSIERQSIALGALNVLIGANGSGKSNLLTALAFFRASALGDRDTAVKRVGGSDRVLFHGKKNTKACFFSCEGDTFSYEQTLLPVAGDRLEVAKEGLKVLDSEIEWTADGADLDSLEEHLRAEERDSRGWNAAARALAAEGGDRAGMGEEEGGLLPHARDQLVEIVGSRCPGARLDAHRIVDAVEEAVAAIVDELVLLLLLDALDRDGQLLLDLIVRAAKQVRDPRVDLDRRRDRRQRVLARLVRVVDQRDR